MLLTTSDTNASILAYKFRLERTGFNMYAEYTQQQLINFPCITFLRRFRIGIHQIKSLGQNFIMKRPDTKVYLK